MASTGISAQTPFTAYQLAGRETGKGLSIYQREFQKVAGQQEGVCTSQRVVLAIIALVAAAASYILFTYSWNPYTSTQILAGSFFGITAVGSTLWVSVQTIRSLFCTKISQKELEQAANIPLTYEAVLKEMEKTETFPRQIHHALSSLNAHQRHSFFAYVHSCYFVEGRSLLNPAQKKLILAFAQFPQEVAKLNIEKIHPEFARLILSSIDPSIVEERDSELRKTGKAFIQKLFLKVGLPLGEENEKIFARHPVLLADLARQTKKEEASKKIVPAYPPECIAKIFAHMTVEQKILFLQKLRAAITAHTWVTELQMIEMVVLRCMSITLIKEFTCSFLPVTEGETASVPTSVHRELLKQFCKWPQPLAFVTYLSSDPRLSETPFIHALDELLKTQARDDFIAYAAKRFEENADALSNAIHIYLEAFTENNLPRLTRLIFVRTPGLMAAALPNLSEIGVMIVQGCLERMTQEDQITFFDKLRMLNGEDFQKRMSYFLLPLRNNKESIPASLPFALLLKHPEHFTNLILKNEKLASEEDRGQLALDLLESLDAHAERIIATLDADSVVGYPYFNFLTNLLIKEANDPSSIISESRARLFARFKFCKVMEEKQGWNLLGESLRDEKWNKQPDGPHWDAFNKIANSAASYIKRGS